MNNVFNSYRGLNSNVYVLFSAQIINSLGHFVRPFITLFLTQKMGLSAVETGFFVWMSAVVWAPASLIGGKLADSIGRRPVLIIFQGLAAVALIPCAFLGISIFIPWLLILSSFFQGIAEPVNDAMLSDITTADERKQAFSLLYLGHNIGFAIGPMLAGFLFENHMQLMFLGDAATTLIAVFIIARLISETKPDEQAVEESLEDELNPERAEEGSLIAVLFKRPRLIVFMFIFILFSLVYSQVGFGIPLQLSSTFGESGPRYFGILMAVNAVTVVILTTVVLHTTTKIVPVLSVALAGIFYAVGFGFLGQTSMFAVIILLTVIWTIGEILSATNASAYIANHAPITHRGRVNSLAPIIMYSGEAIGPILAGYYIDNNSVEAMWNIALILSLAGTLLLFVLYLSERVRKQPENR